MAKPHFNARISAELIRLIRESDEPSYTLARKIGVSPSYIRALRRRNWRPDVSVKRQPKRRKTPPRKYTSGVVKAIRAAFDAGESRVAIARRFGMSLRYVHTLGQDRDMRPDARP